MKKMILILVMATSLFADGIYETFSLDQKAKTPEVAIQNIEVDESEHNDSVRVADPDANVTAAFFNQDYFTEIKRYEPIFFDGDSIDANGTEILKQIMADLNASDMNKSRMTIIGHTAESKDVNNSVSTNWFVSFFQSIATHEGNDPEEDLNISRDRGQKVFEWFRDQNVSEKNMLVDERGGKDKLYTEGVSEGREKNNRVDVTLYLIGDKDRDGVLDPYDACPNTHYGLSVDKYGCSGSLRLDINFKLDSAEVEGENNGSVKSFAKFLIKNPPYDAIIVGHTDEQGRAKYNEGLSLRRAETVVKMLEDYGVAPERLSAEGKGEYEPLITKQQVLADKIALMENNETVDATDANQTVKKSAKKKPAKKKKIKLTREEIQDVYATNRRIQAHYFLRPEPVVEKKKPKAPRLRYKAR